jgi:putative protease
MELVCPAGSLPALKAAVDEGADAVYFGFRDDTNARWFAGLNFSEQRAREGLKYAHDKNANVFLAINTYPQPNGRQRWLRAVDLASDLQVDALIVADLGVMEYARHRYPGLNLHLSVQGSATNVEALRFYHREFGIRRAVLPRVLSLKQVERLAKCSPVALEVFGFGSLCIMAEGRCHLSSYVTGESPNTCGVCSPAKAVQWQEQGTVRQVRLNGMLVDRYHPGESAGYPTLCKGRFKVAGQVFHALEEPVSLNTLQLLPALAAAGIQAIKLEGRQRSPRYAGETARVWRQALDALAREGSQFAPRREWLETLSKMSEGEQTTLGAYHRPWR